MKKILRLTIAALTLAAPSVNAQNGVKEVAANSSSYSPYEVVPTSAPIDCSKPHSRADLFYSNFKSSEFPEPGLYPGDFIYGIRLSGYNTGKALKRHVKVWISHVGFTDYGRYPDTTDGMTLVYDGDCTIYQGGKDSAPVTLLELCFSEDYKYKGEGDDIRLMIESDGEVSDGEVRFWGIDYSWRARMSTSDQADGELGSSERSLSPMLTFMVTSPIVTLTGKVSDQDGHPLGGAEVILSGGLYKRKYTTQTNADGTYSIDIGDSNQSYLATIECPNAFYYTSFENAFMVNGSNPATRDFTIYTKFDYKPGERATIILPYDPDPDWGRYYKLDRIEGSTVIFEPEPRPKADIPYVLFPEQEFSIEFFPFSHRVNTIYNARVTTDKPKIGDGVYKSAELLGTYFSRDYSISLERDNIILLDESSCGEYIYHETGISGARQEAFHAVLKTYGISSDYLKCVFSGEPTIVSMPTVQNLTNADSTYDLQGRRLTQKPQRGVYIQNGKKVVVK